MIQEISEQIVVSHGQIIGSDIWNHQVTMIFLNKKSAQNIVKGFGCSADCLQTMEPTQIIIFTQKGEISGICKDNDDRYRYIKTPTEV